MSDETDIRERLLCALGYAKENERLLTKTEKALRLNTINFDKYIFFAAVLVFAAALYFDTPFLYILLPFFSAVAFDFTKKPVILIANILIAVVSFSLAWVYIDSSGLPIFEKYSKNHILVCVAAFYILFTVAVNFLEKSCLRQRRLKKLVSAVHEYYGNSPEPLGEAVKPEHFTISNINTLIEFYDKGYTSDYSALYDALDKSGVLKRLPSGGGL